MPNQQLIEYITQRTAQGAREEEIRSALLGAGWKEQDVNEGLLAVFPVSASAQKSAVGGKSKMLIVAVSVLAALLLAGGGFAYWYFVYEVSQPEQREYASQQNQEVKGEVSPAPAGQGEKNIIPQKPVATNLETPDCGVSTSFLDETKAINEVDVSKDDALACFGRNIIAGCKEAHVILETSGAGKLDYIIKGKTDVGCALQLGYGDAEQIPFEEQKVYANKYVECPMDVNKLFREAKVNQENPSEGPAELAATLYLYIGFLMLDTSSGCTGTIFMN